MTKNYLWTKSKARLLCVEIRGGKNLNWLFLPGGPGLGSEYLISLTDILKLPGTTWLLDLPGDGSNTTSNNKESFAHWSQALIEATSAVKNVILVGHSRGGMFALATAELQNILIGLVLLDAAPDSTWQEKFAARIKHISCPESEKCEQLYEKNPSNSTLKNFVLSGAPYMFTKEFIDKGRSCLKDLPYNFETIQWTQEHFDPTYSARWVPDTMPTLILAGENSLPTPLELFSEKSEFKREHILMLQIKNAGHFPWIDNPTDTIAAFTKFQTQFRLL